MSAPATKAFSPEPVMMITLTFLSASNILKALLNSAMVAEFRAFN